MTIKIEQFDLPAHWASALFYGDIDDLDPADVATIERFEAWMVETYGRCCCIDVSEGWEFARIHDAAWLGVLACDVSTFTFDVTQED